MRRFALILTGLLFAAAARADVVHLKNGKSIEGKVTVEGDKVTVQIPFGSVSFPKSKVLRIERKESSIDVYEQKLAALKKGDAAGRLELAAWCRKQGLRARGETLLREVLEFDPENTAARKLMGYVKHGGEWVTPEEKYRALGMIKFEGQWHKPESVAAVKKARAAAVQAEAERRKTELELKLKIAELEKLNAERARLEAERRKLEAERARLEAERRRMGRVLGRYPQFRVIGGSLYYYPEYPSYKKGIIIIRASKSSPKKEPEKKTEPVPGAKAPTSGRPKAVDKAAPGA